MKKNQHILFITTASLAANPRLIKEVTFLKQHHKCTVMYFEHQDWTADLSKEIIKNNPEVKFIAINRGRNLSATLKSKLAHKLSILMNSRFQKNLRVAAYASNDKTPQLVLALQKLCKSENFDVVIAHNLGAFYPALKVAQCQNSELQLDIEDFYPGEALYFNKTHEKQNRHVLMQAGFRRANNITYASVGIARACHEHYQIPTETKQEIILNSFSSSDFVKPEAKKKDTIRCVWFSQNIGPNRGLEQIFEAARANPLIEFHLIGNADRTYLEQNELSTNIILHPIMPQIELHGFLSTMDVGLALESPTADANRNICLTNKILAYTQAGLFILATPTYAQQQFLESLVYYPGQLIKENLRQSLAEINMQRFDLPSKNKRWEAAKAFDWEVEREKLNQLI